MGIEKLIRVNENEDLGIYSDTHENTEYPDSLFEGNYNLVFLGDIGKGDAGKVKSIVDKFNDYGVKGVLGSHDKAVIDIEKRESYKARAKESENNGDERGAKRFTKFYKNAENLANNLENKYIDYYKSLPKNVVMNYNGKKIVAIHDALKKDNSLGGFYRNRIITKELARKNFEGADFDILLVGHSHEPCMFKLDKNGNIEHTIFKDTEEGINLNKEGYRYIINPGSLGGGLRYYNKIGERKPFNRDPRKTYVQIKPDLTMDIIFSKK
jgi:predicted phosphodiesterase